MNFIYQHIFDTFEHLDLVKIFRIFGRHSGNIVIEGVMQGGLICHHKHQVTLGIFSHIFCYNYSNPGHLLHPFKKWAQLDVGKESILKCLSHVKSISLDINKH